MCILSFRSVIRTKNSRAPFKQTTSGETKLCSVNLGFVLGGLGAPVNPEPRRASACRMLRPREEYFGGNVLAAGRQGLRGRVLQGGGMEAGREVDARRRGVPRLQGPSPGQDGGVWRRGGRAP
jgi:hypothetical protein